MRERVNAQMFLWLQVLDEEQHKQANQNEYNFDHPDAFDFKLLVNTLHRLKHGKKVEVPVYNFISHSRESKSVSLYPIFTGLAGV